MVRPVQTPAVSAAIAAFPPPYRFTANVTWLPATGNGAAMAAALDGGATRVGGRALAAVMCAVYTAIHYGPKGLLALDDAGRPYRYREVAWLGLRPFGLRQRLRFGRLWVDAPTSLPVDLGDTYGFPKVAAAVRADEAGMTADDGLTPRISAAWRRLVGLPAGVMRLSPGGVVSSALGVTAGLGVVSAGGAELVRVTGWQYPAGDLDLRPLGWGLALRDAQIYLGAPR